MVKHKVVGLTGHRGFIGARLSSYLDLLGYEVIRFSGNMLDRTDIKDYLESNPSLDAVVHLAGTFFGSTEEILEKNALATAILADEISYRNGLQLIFASSGAVYGNTSGSGASENEELFPNTIYGLSKKWSEDSIYYYHQSAELNYIVLRLPSVYGPGEGKGVIARWLDQVTEDRIVRLHGDGTQMRSFLHIDGLCSAIVYSLDYKGSGVFNISDENAISLNELISLFKQYFIFEVEYSPSSNPLHSMVLDSRNALKELGWKSSHKLADYLDSITE